MLSGHSQVMFMAVSRWAAGGGTPGHLLMGGGALRKEKCSDKLGGFCDLSYLGEFRCFLSGVFFCIAGSIIGVYGYLGSICS